LRTVRRNNAREAALRHDWLHRIRVVFDVLGLAPTEEMRARAKRLDQIAFTGWTLVISRYPCEPQELLEIANRNRSPGRDRCRDQSLHAPVPQYALYDPSPICPL
jgi:hypothetical protein